MTNSDSAPFGIIQFDQDGVYVRRRDRKHRIGDPILVTAFATEDEDTRCAQAFVVIEFKTRRGQWKKNIVPSSMLTGNNRDFVARLSDLGYLWPSDRKSWPRIIAALSTAKPDQHIRLVSVPGWHGDSYVLPDEAYTPSGPNRRDFLIDPNPSVKLGEFCRSGTLNKWQTIARLCCHSSRGRLLMAAAFAAPNLRLLGISSFGINLSGESTTGKSSLVVLACSAPGLNTNEGPATWDGTAPGYEQRALGHRDGIMPLDDLSSVEGNPAQAAKLLTFRLAGNRPKSKAGEYVRANKLVEHEYRVIAVSTSEDPIWQHLQQRTRNGRRVRGEQVRMINVRAAVSKVGDVFDGRKADRRLGKTVEGRARKIEKYSELAVKYQGEAYRAYLATLMADKTAAHILRQYMTQYFSAVPVPKQYRWLRRVARYFAALYAGAALAIDYGILPWNRSATLADIRKCMEDAFEELISYFESKPNDGDVPDRDTESEVAEFKDLVDRATFVRLDRRTHGKRRMARRLRNADGIIRRDKSGTARRFLFSETLSRWYPKASRRKRLTKLLRAHRIFGEGRRPDTAICEPFVSELGGKIPCYALSRKRLKSYFHRSEQILRTERTTSSLPSPPPPLN